jgi:uncharacterized HAD superfamily protein
MPNERLVRIALGILNEDCTLVECVKMINVLIPRKNKVDNAVEIANEALKRKEWQ